MTTARRSLSLCIVAGSFVHPPSTYAQSFFNKAFEYESRMGNLEPVSDPEGFLICSTVRYYGLPDIDGFQFSRFDSTGSVLFTKGFSTGPTYNSMQLGALALSRSDGTFSFLFDNNPETGYKRSLRIFNAAPMGSINWNRKIDYVYPEYSVELRGLFKPTFEETPDDGYLITASRYYPSASVHDTVAPMMLKLDASGNVLWNKTYDLGLSCGWHITSHVDTAGEVLLGFQADSPCATVSDNCILTKIDPSGNTHWSKRIIGFEGGLTDCEKGDGRYVVCGIDTTCISLLSIDSTGAPLWGMRYLMAPRRPMFGSITPLRDHGFAVRVAMLDTMNGNDAEVLIFKVDSLGIVQWERTYGNESSEVPIDMIENGDGTFTMITVTQLLPSTHTYYYLSKLDSLGMNDCMMPANGLLTAAPITFSLIDIVLNEFQSPMISQPLYVNDTVAYDPMMTDTCLIEVAVPDHGRSDELLIYPNPTSGTISVRVPGQLLGSSLTIVDLFAKRIKSITLSETETLLDLSSLSRGPYLYHVVTQSGKSLSGRLIKE